MLRRLLPAALLLALAAPLAQAQSAESLIVQSAIDEYQRTGRARVLEVGQTILVPYNQVDPVLKTALLRTTLIELGPNEYVVDRFMGDSLRWSVDFGVTGDETNFRQIVSVKPTDQDITTSLVLTTNEGRVYHFTLDSEPYAGIARGETNPTDIPYTSHVKFYYPDEGIDSRSIFDKASLDGYAPFTLDDLPLNTAHYTVRADQTFPCPPTRVGDDGTRLQVFFPDHTENPACAQRFPMYSVDVNGDLQLLDYIIEGGNTYVTGRIPAEARLLYRSEDGDLHQVKIRNKRVRRSGVGRTGVLLGLGIGSLVPSGQAAFQNTYSPGLSLGGELGFRTSRAFSVGLQLGYDSVPTDLAYVNDGLGVALENLYAGDYEAELGEALGDENVLLSARASGGDVRTMRGSVVGRLSLLPSARLQPYLSGRVGFLRRSVDALRFGVEGRVTNGRRSEPNDQLDNLLARDFAEANDLADFREELLTDLTEEGTERVLPVFLFTNQTTETGVDLGAGGGLQFQATKLIGIYAEAEYAYSPVGDRPDRARIPLTFGVRANL